MTSERLLEEVDRYLNIFVSPLMMIVSMVGNSLSLVVLSRRSFCDLPMSVYLRFLAVMDTGTVISGLLPRFILALTDCDVRGTNELSCQFQVYMVYVFTELSAWTLVIVTSERVLSIMKPHKVKLLCTKTKSYITLVSTVTFFLIANLPIFFLFGKASMAEVRGISFEISDKNWDVSSFEEKNSTRNGGANITDLDFRICVSKGNNRSIVEAWYLTHFVKQSLLPFVSLFVMNIVIITGLARRHSSVLRYQCSSRDLRAMFSHARVSAITEQHKEVRSTSRLISRRNLSLSLTLVTLNAVFMICTFPIGIYQQIVSNLPERGRDAPAQNITFTMLVFVLYLNNTLNFFLYCLTGSRFREELGFMLSSRPSQEAWIPTRDSAEQSTI